MRVACAVMLLVACGDDSSVVDASADGGVDAPFVDASDAGGEVEVALPAPPQWECPAGWVASDEPAAHCEPPGARVDCPEGQARFIDSSACEPVAACPAGAFAEGLPGSSVWYVEVGGDGDGSMGDPFSLDDALAVADAGDTIALAAGTYDGFVDVPDEVAIVGKCPSETRLTWSGIDDTRPVVLVSPGQSASLTGLTIGPVAGVGILANGTLELDSVIVDGASGAGILITRLGSVSGSSVVVRGTTPRGGTSGGMGVIVDGGTLTATRWVVRNNVRNGVRIDDGGDAEIEDLVAIDNVGVEPLLQGSGVHLLDGTLILRRADLRGAANVALEVTGGVATAEDVFIDEADVVDPPGGTLLSVRDGELDVSRAFIRGTSWTVNGSEGTLALRDAVIVNGGGDFIWAENVGISTIGTEVTLERIVIVGGDSGILLSGPLDFSIPLDPLDPPPERDPLENPTAFSIADVDIRGTGAGVRFGYGLLLQEGMEGTLDRAHVTMGRGHGIDIETSRVTASDLTVLDALPGGDQEGRPSFGRGLSTDQSFVSVTRARVARAIEIGVEARGGTLDLQDVTIDATLERPCAETGECSDAPGGIGLGAYFDAQVSASNLRVYDAPLCGVQLAFDAALDLSGGEITGATVGACVQVEGYDVRRLTNGVTYDNATNIESTAHEIPEAPPPPTL